MTAVSGDNHFEKAISGLTQDEKEGVKMDAIMERVYQRYEKTIANQQRIIEEKDREIEKQQREAEKRRAELEAKDNRISELEQILRDLKYGAGLA